MKRVITPENYVSQAKNSNSANSWSNGSKCSWYIYQVKGTVLKALHVLSGRYYYHLLIEIQLTYNIV